MNRSNVVERLIKSRSRHNVLKILFQLIWLLPLFLMFTVGTHLYLAVKDEYSCEAVLYTIKKNYNSDFVFNFRRIHEIGFFEIFEYSFGEKQYQDIPWSLNIIFQRPVSIEKEHAIKSEIIGAFDFKGVDNSITILNPDTPEKMAYVRGHYKYLVIRFIGMITMLIIGCGMWVLRRQKKLAKNDRAVGTLMPCR